MTTEEEKQRKAIETLMGTEMADLIMAVKGRIEKEKKSLQKKQAPFFVQWPRDQGILGDGSSFKRLGEAQRANRTPMYGLKAGSPPDNSPRPGSAIAKVEFPKSKKPDDKITKSEFTTMLESLTGILKELLGKLDKLGPEIEALEQKRLGKKSYPSIRDYFSKN